jgi:predicted secreted hydrolase
MKLIRVIFVSIAMFFLTGAVFATESVVSPDYRIELPRDGGSHPEFATEWWYLTGWLKDASGKRRGFQITFFRSRNASADNNPSAFSPRQILFAHAALSDPAEKKLLSGERTARAGFGLAEAKQGSTHVLIDDWTLLGEGTDVVTNQFTTRVATKDFSLSLKLKSTQPVLLQGEQGYSRKGSDPSSASHYYSLPQLEVSGLIDIRGTKIEVAGEAWFDHEWSNVYVDPQSVGWDWIGINLANGDALMAFRMRDAQGKQQWAGGTTRRSGKTQTFSPEQITWTPLRQWRSPRTGVSYPIAWRVKISEQEIVLRPLMDDQENDARGSVGILYWEGAVEALDTAGNLLGRGYLELTGYGDPVKL